MKQVSTIIFASLSLLVNFPALAQASSASDSLHRALRVAPNDTARASVLMAITRYAPQDSTLFYSARVIKAVKEALPKANKAEKHSLLLNKADAIKHFGYYYDVQGDFPKVVKYFTDALSIYRQLGDEKREGEALIKIGSAYHEMGNVKQTLAVLERGLRISRKINNHIAVASALNTLGNLRFHQGDTLGALKDYTQAYKAAAKSGNKNFEYGVQFNNLGILFQTKQYAEVHKLALELLENGKKYNLPYVQAQAYKFLGKVATVRGQYEDAARLLTLGLASAKAYVSPQLEGILYYEFGELYFKSGDYSKGIYHSLQANTLAEKTHSLKLHRLTTEVLSKLYEKNSQPALALHHYKQTIVLRDSLQNAKKHEALVKQQYQSEFEQKEALLKAEQDKKQALAHKEIEKQQFQRNTMLGGAVMLLLLLGVLYSRYRLKQRKNQELEVAYSDLERAQNELLQKEKALFAKQVLELELKALRAQMNPHFIFNCLNAIQAIILNEDKRTATDYLQKFSRLIRLILDNSRKESTTLEDETEILTLYLDLEQLRMGNKFDYEIDIPDEVESAFTEFPSMVIQPIVENSIWHGLMPSEQKGHLRISFRRNEDQLTCVVEDNGIGRERSQQLKGSTGHDSKGLKLIEERLQTWSQTRELDCKIRVLDTTGYGSGTRTEITIQYARVYA